MLRMAAIVVLATLMAILNGTLSVDAAFDDSLRVLDAGEAYTRLLCSTPDAAFPVERRHAVNF
jgi:hypothetical protein